MERVIKKERKRNRMREREEGRGAPGPVQLDSHGVELNFSTGGRLG